MRYVKLFPFTPHSIGIGLESHPIKHMPPLQGEVKKVFIFDIVTFFVIATKKVRSVILSVSEGSQYSMPCKMRCFANAQHDGQTRSLRAFCLASATLLGSVILSESEGSQP